MTWLLNSIGKKIALIIILSIISIMLLVFISVKFFVKIGDVGSISQAAYAYEVLLKNTSIEFRQFYISGNEENYKSLTKYLQSISTTDGRMGSVYRQFKNGKSMDEVVQLEMQKTGSTEEDVRRTASLIKALMGTELAEKLVKKTDLAHEKSSGLIDLVDKIHKTKDTEVKQQIAQKFMSLEGEFAGVLVDFHGVMNEVGAHFMKKIEIIFLVISFIAIFLLCVLAFVITRSVTRPLKETVTFLKAVSGGDLTQELQINQQDEVGVMASSMNDMAVNLRNILKKMVSGTQTLTASSAELLSVSGEISSNSQKTADRSNNVAASAEEMSTNMNSVAAAMEQTATNIQMVVSAVEEMTSTINEISGNTSKGSETTNMAVGRAKEVSAKVAELGAAAQEINKVTETIAEISEQTNLLALNATIEAARAGEAGKGFAVVASEIKALAQQTAGATTEISRKIQGVQETTQGSITAIESIVHVIDEINSIVTTIASAIEEQSITTREIASNVAQAAEGVQEVNSNVTQSSTAADDVTREIAGVSQATDDLNVGSKKVEQSANELAHLAENLNGLASLFKIE